MSFPSRLQIGILVTATTLIVCSLGVRAELKMSEASIGRGQTRAAAKSESTAALTLFGHTAQEISNLLVVGLCATPKAMAETASGRT